MTTPERLHVAFFFRGDFPNGSNALRTRNMVKGLRANGIEASIIVTFPPPDRSSTPLLRREESFTLGPAAFPLTGIRKVVLKIRGTVTGFRMLLRRRREITTVFLTAPGFLEGALVLLFCRLWNVRFLAERGDVIRWRYSEVRITLVQRLAILQDTLFDRLILRNVDVLFVVSSFLEERYRRIMPTGSLRRITPALIDLEEYRRLQRAPLSERAKSAVPPRSASRVRILYAGSCLETNGIKHMLRCADAVYARHGEDIEVVLVLSVGLIDDIDRFVRTLAVADRCRVLRGLAFTDVVPLYQTADIIVIPEMGDVVANAGFPSKTSECLASGRPVIATEFSDIPRYIVHGRSGMLSPVGDEERYTENLLRLVRDRSLRDTMGAEGAAAARAQFENAAAVSMLVEAARGVR
ncbi:MAG: glycosyltransferase family 4 protein [Bacteroidetes bacterium]|nr:MAG: glycosyltransferase family 4 protein [Bacteroidota bacterium]